MKREKIDFKLLGQLFWSMFTLSACTFGGGFVIVSLMKKKVVEERHWLEEDEMLNLVAIAQSAPGPVAVNASMILGYQLGGGIGALVSILGTILPPLVTLSVISAAYQAFSENAVVQAVLRGMQAGIAAVIADTIFTLAGNVLRERSVLSVFLMAASFAAVYFGGVNVVVIILICGAVGIGRGYLAMRRERRA